MRQFRIPSGRRIRSIYTEEHPLFFPSPPPQTALASQASAQGLLSPSASQQQQQQQQAALYAAASRSNPLLMVTADDSPDLCAYDMLTGSVRAVFRTSSHRTLDGTTAAGTGANAAQSPSHVRSPSSSTSTSAVPSSRASQGGAPSSSSSSAFETELTAPWPLPSGLLIDPVRPRGSNLVDPIIGVTLLNSRPLLPSSRPVSVSGALFCRDSFVITAGTDSVVRYWDIKEPHRSARICGEHVRFVYLRVQFARCIVWVDCLRMEMCTVHFSCTLLLHFLPEFIFHLFSTPPLPLFFLHSLRFQPLSRVQFSLSTHLGGTGAAPVPYYMFQEESQPLPPSLAGVSRFHDQIRPLQAHSEPISFLKAVELPHRLLITAGGNEAKLWI